MTDCSKCAITKRLKEKTDIKISNADVLSRVIYEKINKNSLTDKEKLELNACVSKTKKEKNISQKTAEKICITKKRQKQMRKLGYH